MLCFASRSVIYRPISSRNWSCSFFRAMQRVIDGWTRLQSDVWITPLETVSLMSSGQQFYWRQPLARTACLQVMMTDTRHRVIDRPIKTLRHQSAGLQKCSMKAGQSLFSLFAHSPAHATRGSRLEYRTRFLAAPPAGILEQKRDCSQSRGGVISILIIYVPPKIIHFPPRINYSSYFQQHVRQWRRTAYCAEYRGKIWWDSWGKWRVSFRIVRTVMKIIISML